MCFIFWERDCFGSDLVQRNGTPNGKSVYILFEYVASLFNYIIILFSFFDRTLVFFRQTFWVCIVSSFSGPESTFLLFILFLNMSLIILLAFNFLLCYFVLLLQNAPLMQVCTNDGGKNKLVQQEILNIF